MHKPGAQGQKPRQPNHLHLLETCGFASRDRSLFAFIGYNNTKQNYEVFF